MTKSPEGGSLFDLEKDPKELNNVAAQHPDICEQMKAKAPGNPPKAGNQGRQGRTSFRWTTNTHSSLNHERIRHMLPVRARVYLPGRAG